MTSKSCPGMITRHQVYHRKGRCVMWTHILVVLQKNMEIEVFPENWVSSNAAQKDLMHGNSFLKDGQILSETETGKLVRRH